MSDYLHYQPDDQLPLEDVFYLIGLAEDDHRESIAENPSSSLSDEQKTSLSDRLRSLGILLK